MKQKKILLLLIALVLAIAQGRAFEMIHIDVNPTNVQLATAVEQRTTATVTFLFGEIELVELEKDLEDDGSSFNATLGNYSVSITGADKRMFAATVTQSDIISGTCKVQITYLPINAGPHHATLTVQNSSGSLKRVSLNGTTSEEYRDPMSIHTTGMPVADQMGITPVDGGSSPDITPETTDTVITVSTSSIDFGNVYVGSHLTQTFRVKGYNLTGPLTLMLVASRSASCDGFSIGTTSITAAQAANGATVSVSYWPTAAGVQNTISVLISGGGAPSVQVALRGTGVDELPIIVSPSSLAFGDVGTDESVTQELTVTLEDTETFGMLRLEPTLNDPTGMFSISPKTITPAQAAEGAKVQVTYRPTAAGTHNATFSICSRGLQSEPILVSGIAHQVISTILITTADGTTMEYLIDENSEISFEQSNLVVKTSDAVLTYDLSQMEQLRYGTRAIYDNSGSGVLKVGSLLLHGQDENALVEVTDSNGRAVSQYTGSGSISLDNEPSGLYLISTPSQTIKIEKQ